MTGAGTCTTPSRAPDWLGDQDAIGNLCRNAPAAVTSWNIGLAFLAPREDGKIYQRPFGGHDHQLRQGHRPAHCAAADRTASMLHTMYGQALRHSAEFSSNISPSIDHGRRGPLPRRCRLRPDDGSIHRSPRI